LGVNLTPIVVRHLVRLENLAGRKLAVDANNYLYQFLALVRLPDGVPLRSPDGTVTSHLAGLLYRTTRLISDYGLNLIFVFDGKPPEHKAKEIEKRRAMREKATEKWQEALAAGDYAAAFSKAVMTSRLTQSMVEDAKKLLDVLGVPFVQAPSEAEAQAAYMAGRGDVWASSSRDYDSLLFGTPRLLRYLTISGREFLPSKRASRPLKPELIILEEFLSECGITRLQLIDLAILIGTDFNEGVKGIGPKTALKLMRKYGAIENLSGDVRREIPAYYEDVRRLFLEPEVTSEYTTDYRQPKEEELYTFLCGERGFSRDRVEKAVERIKGSRKAIEQADLKRWFTEADQPI